VTETGAPPTSPEVKQQQQGPELSQMAQKAAAQGQKPQQGQGDPTSQFIMQGFQQIAQVMGQMAQGMATKAPQLIDLLTKLAGGFKELETQFQQTMQQGPGNNPQGQPGTEPTQTAAEAPAAMGM
jgi:hypothetical protein